ncbi:MAG: hypothetical protein PHY15_06685 [Eubacteriales bacterium]|nr:hypothetical protein [Eubacteriales bacterium]MDD4475750.1 hypothetical protein [Eubacteriales bacterium]
MLCSVLVFETSACNVPLTTSRNYRDLDSSYTYILKTAITCTYNVGSIFGNGTSKTVCETTSDQFCGVWVRMVDNNKAVSFDDNEGNVKSQLSTIPIRLQSSMSAIESWHGAYRVINGYRNLDARIEYYDDID